MKRLSAMFLSLILLLCGCTSNTEIDRLMIVSGIAIDSDPDGYKITTQTVNVKSDNQNDQSAVLFETRAESFSKALSDIVTMDGEKLYLNHTEVIFLNSELLRTEGISHISKTINLSSKFRSSIRLAVCDTEASDILKSEPETQKITAFALNDAIDQSSKLLMTPDAPFYSFHNDVLESGVDGILPLISLKEENEKLVPQISGTALFKDDHLCCYLSVYHTQFLLMLKKSTDDGALAIGENYFAVTKCRPKITCSKDSVTVDLNATLLLVEGTTYDEKENRILAEKEIKKGVYELFSILKANGCDPLGLGRSLKRRDFSFWKSVYPDDWAEFYRDLPVEINVKVKIADSPKIAEKE